MPTFGDYETIGEPIVSREEHGHVSTIWQARKIGANDGRLYVVKHYVPRRGDAREAGDALGIDRGLEFLGGGKHLKQDYNGVGHCLAPIYDFGSTYDGVWYATDFY